MRLTRLPLLLISALFLTSQAQAQTPPPPKPPGLSAGDAIVSGFSGIAAPPGTAAQTRIPPERAFINPDGPSAKILDVGRPGHIWEGRVIPTNARFEVFARETGQVFGVATGSGPNADIYLAATSAYGLNLVARNRNGAFERRKKGGPGTGWMRGQFGLDLQGGPGSIYKVDGRTGAVSLLTNVLLENVPNHGPGLGNLAYDAANKQLFVSDLATGMIHRIGLDGADLEQFDHGVNGRPAAQMQPVPFDPRGRASIARAEFDTENPDTWGFASPSRRVYAVTIHQGRLYYSAGEKSQIWSIGIAQNGAFANDPRLELEVPGQAAQIGVTDIAFSEKGAMILAERAATSGNFAMTELVKAGEPRVLRFWPKQPNDPAPGLWTPQPEEYAVGFAGQFRNTNGGVALGYGYDNTGNLARNSCEASLWTSAQNIRNALALRDRLEPGGPLVLQGLQGMPSGPVRDASNQPPWLSYNVDYDGKPGDQNTSGYMGGVRIFTEPCIPPVANFGGPGYPGAAPYLSAAAPAGVSNPPYISGGDCTGPNCTSCVGSQCDPCRNDPRLVCGDISIKKTGATTPDLETGAYTFTLTVTNNGPAYTAASGVLTVTDTVPANMTIANPTVPGWSCNGPVTGPGTLTCTYLGGPVPSGVVTTISLSGTATGPRPFPPFTNCAEVFPGASYQDSDPSNNKDCVTVEKPGILIVKKQIDNQPGPVLFPPMTFPVTVTCGSTVTNLTLASNGTTQTVNNIPIGTSCTVVEDTSSIVTPAGYCQPPKVAVWTASYVPPGPYVITSTPITVTVHNKFECDDKKTGDVIVKKEVINHSPIPVPSMTFPATVTCGGTSASINLPSNGTPITVNNMPLGSTCTVAEGTPTVNACPPPLVDSWTKVSVPASTTVANPPNTITVQNTLECKKVGDGSIIVKKEVSGGVAGKPIPSMTFPVTVACGSQVTNLTLSSDGTPQTVSNIPAGTVVAP